MDLKSFAKNLHQSTANPREQPKRRCKILDEKRNENIIPASMAGQILRRNGIKVQTPAIIRQKSAENFMEESKENKPLNSSQQRTISLTLPPKPDFHHQSFPSDDDSTVIKKQLKENNQFCNSKEENNHRKKKQKSTSSESTEENHYHEINSQEEKEIKIKAPQQENKELKLKVEKLQKQISNVKKMLEDTESDANANQRTKSRHSNDNCLDPIRHFSHYREELGDLIVSSLNEMKKSVEFMTVEKRRREEQRSIDKAKIASLEQEKERLGIIEEVYEPILKQFQQSEKEKGELMEEKRELEERLHKSNLQNQKYKSEILILKGKLEQSSQNDEWNDNLNRLLEEKDNQLQSEKSKTALLEETCEQLQQQIEEMEKKHIPNLESNYEAATQADPNFIQTDNIMESKGEMQKCLHDLQENEEERVLKLQKLLVHTYTELQKSKSRLNGYKSSDLGFISSQDLSVSQE